MILDQYNKLGSVFTVNFVGKKVTFLVGPEVSAHFYQGPESEVRMMLYEFSVPLVGKDTMLNDVDVTTRYEQVRFYSDALKPSKLRYTVSGMLQEVEEFFGKWGEQGTVDLGQEFSQLITLITGRCLLGKEVRENMVDEFFTLFNELIDNGFHLMSMVFPYAPTITNYRRDRARAKIGEMLTKIVRLRKASNRVEEDMLQKLIDFKYKDGRSTTESEITSLMIALIIASKHSSSPTLTWTGVHLLSNSRWLNIAIEEQKDIVSKKGDHIDYNTLLEMENLHRCIKETLRMHPVIMVLLRNVQKAFTVQTNEGNVYEIPRGHTIASPVSFNSKMPHIYKDPEVYDPDRFGPPREEDKVGGKFSYLAFSAGRHTCPGEAYAYTQMKVIWSHLLRNFELILVSPFPEDDWTKMVQAPKGKVIVSYKRKQLLP